MFPLDLSVETGHQILRYRNVINFEDHLNVISVNSLMNYKNMADMRICEMLSTQPSPTLGINNDDYGSWSTVHCVQCVVQCEGNVAVGLWVVGFGLL